MLVSIFLICGKGILSHSVVKHPVQVALVSVKLHSPSVDIANSVGGSSLGADCGNSKQCLGLLANFIEKTCRGNIGAIVSNFEFAVSAAIVSRLPNRLLYATYPAALACTTLFPPVPG